MTTTKPINSHNQTGTGELIAKKSIPDKEVAQPYSKSDCHQNINSQIEELKKGCGKEINHNILNEITICKILPKYSVFIESAGNLTKDGFKAIQKVCNAPTYKFELCEVCQAKLTTLQEAQSQFLEMLDDLVFKTNSFSVDLLKDNTIWRLNGDELNDLWEDWIIKELEKKKSQLTGDEK